MTLVFSACLCLTLLKSLYSLIMTNSILKSINIIFSTTVHIVKSMVFPVVIIRYDSWTIKKAEHWKHDAFKLWFWRRLLRVPWTTRRLNQSILKKITPEYSLEGLMLKQKLQYFGHLLRRDDSLGKTLMLGKIESKRIRWQRIRWLDGISNSMDMNLSKLWEGRGGWHAAVHRATRVRYNLVTKQQQQEKEHIFYWNKFTLGTMLQNNFGHNLWMTCKWSRLRNNSEILQNLHTYQ